MSGRGGLFALQVLIWFALWGAGTSRWVGDMIRNAYKFEEWFFADSAG